MQLPTQLLQRRPDAHKGDFGHIFIIGGSARYSGAVVLSGAAAMRSGAGLVTLGIPAGLNNAIIKIKPREVMTFPLPGTKGTLKYGGLKKIREFIKNVDVVVIGPGLGREVSTQHLARALISGIDKPIVIDADALNALAGHLEILKTKVPVGRQVVLTPHPGEMSKVLGITPAEVQKNRKTLAIKFAKDYNVTLVLKGHNTVVTDFKNLYINRTGNPGMATAGSGDVLTGIIAAFLGQGMGAFDAAKYAVYVHGLAGDLAARAKTQISLIASDIIEKIPAAVKKSM